MRIKTHQQIHDEINSMFMTTHLGIVQHSLTTNQGEKQTAGPEYVCVIIQIQDKHTHNFIEKKHKVHSFLSYTHVVLKCTELKILVL